MEALKLEDLIDRKFFGPGQEYELVGHLLTVKLTYHIKRQIQVNICTSSIRVMNKICKSVYTAKVMDKMKPGCQLVRTHLLDCDFNKIRYHTPAGKNAELIKLLRF